MGTRADFYIGTGPSAEWLGSITHDGYPDGTPSQLVKARSEHRFRAEVESMLSDRTITSTRPAEGWPWPWEDSRTTDYAYAWCADGKVRMSGFGGQWETLAEHNKRNRNGGAPDLPQMRDDEVRDMSALTADASTVLAKSGLVIIGVPR